MKYFPMRDDGLRVADSNIETARLLALAAPHNEPVYISKYTIYPATCQVPNRDSLRKDSARFA